MKSLYRNVLSADQIGDGTAGDLVAWLEKYVKVLFPHAGIEYFADNQYAKAPSLKRFSPVPKPGSVHHVACYVREGNCEGRIIEMSLCLRTGELSNISWIKTFGPDEECWAIARAVSQMLNGLIFWNEIPELVELYEKVPRRYPWERRTTLTEEVTIRIGHASVLVSTPTVVLDDRIVEGVYPITAQLARNLGEDWKTVLAACDARFVMLEEIDLTGEYREVVVDADDQTKAVGHLAIAA